MNSNDNSDRPLFDDPVNANEEDTTPSECPDHTSAKQMKAPSTLKFAHELLQFLERVHAVDPVAATSAADCFLERTCPQCPELAPFYESLPSETKYFADHCCERLAGEMLWNLLDRFSTKKIQSLKLRKKIFWKIWDTLGPKDRASFLAWAQRETERETEGG